MSLTYDAYAIGMKLRGRWPGWKEAWRTSVGAGEVLDWVGTLVVARGWGMARVSTPHPRAAPLPLFDTYQHIVNVAEFMYEKHRTHVDKNPNHCYACNNNSTIRRR